MSIKGTIWLLETRQARRARSCKRCSCGGHEGASLAPLRTTPNNATQVHATVEEQRQPRQPHRLLFHGVAQRDHPEVRDAGRRGLLSRRRLALRCMQAPRVAGFGVPCVCTRTAGATRGQAAAGHAAVSQLVGRTTTQRYAFAGGGALQAAAAHASRSRGPQPRR